MDLAQELRTIYQDANKMALGKLSPNMRSRLFNLLTILKEYEEELQEEKRLKSYSHVTSSAKIPKSFPPIPDKEKLKRDRLAIIARKENSEALEKPQAKLLTEEKIPKLDRVPQIPQNRLQESSSTSAVVAKPATRVAGARKNSNNKNSSINISPPTDLSSRTWAVFNGLDGKFLYGKKAHLKMEIASLTKMMTCILSLKLIEKYGINRHNTFFKVSYTAAMTKGTTAELQEDDVLSINDLLFGLMLPSGNDAAVVLGEHLGAIIFLKEQNLISKIPQYFFFEEYSCVKDSTRYFIREMNKLAFDLNLNNTCFYCVHGLQRRLDKYDSAERTKSTAYDIGRLSAYCMETFDFRNIVKTKKHEGRLMNPFGLFRSMQWENTNKLLDEGFSGIKTGFTNSAGACLASCYQSYNESSGAYVNFIIVVLAADQVEDRFKDSQKLLEWIIGKTCSDIEI